MFSDVYHRISQISHNISNISYYQSGVCTKTDLEFCLIVDSDLSSLFYGYKGKYIEYGGVSSMCLPYVVIVR